jgi:hypothetical protein
MPQAMPQAGRQAGTDEKGVTPTGSANDGALEDAAEHITDRVAFHRVGDTFEPASSEPQLTPADRATDFLQFLQGRGLGGGWFWRSDLEGIYGRFVRDFGLTSMSWTAVMRGLSEVTDKRRKERGCRCLPDGEWQWPTEMQYYVPRPKSPGRVNDRGR